MTRLDPNFVRINTNSAEETAETWAATDKAQAQLARLYMLDELIQTLAGHDLDSVTDAIGEEVSNAECELDNIRTEQLSEAWAQHPSNDDDVQYDLDENAPSVADAIAHHRRYMRGREMAECFAPVRWTSPNTVAA